jgi:class 3 adenylate cyclase
VISAVLTVRRPPERALAIGDRSWRELLAAFRAKVRDTLRNFNGREINTAGDGFLAAFDGPARAIRCAGTIRDAARSLGLEVRCGLHTGECELVGEGLAGIAVHIGARVTALAAPGEVLVRRGLGLGRRFDSRNETLRQRGNRTP